MNLKLPPIQHHKDLTLDNTLRFQQFAQHFADVTNEDQLVALVNMAQQNDMPLFTLGGGSNIVLAGDIPGMTIRQVNQNVHHDLVEDHHRVITTVSAGTPWQTLVDDTIRNNIRGLENLTLIPGLVGAAPVQNIGAYGVELSDRLHSVRAFHVRTGQWKNFNREQCEFSYRQSLFKRSRGEYIITEVRLDLGLHHPLVTDYQPLRAYLDSHFQGRATLDTISRSVASIRRKKLPDPSQLPNVGSFFHNPIIKAEHFEQLAKAYPGIVGYEQTDGRFKVAAGWLIEYLGFKGHRIDGVGVHTEQALVLVHHGGSNGNALLALANNITAKVKEEFDVVLETEPTIVH